MQKLEDAHIFRRTIDVAVYERHRDRIQEEIALAELELHDSRIEESDVKGILAFAEHLISNLASVWIEATLHQRQQIQAALFPCGLPFDGERFGTALTCLMFSELQGFREPEMVASPTIPSWNQIADFLKTMQQLRDSTGFAA